MSSAKLFIFTILSFVLVTGGINLTPTTPQLFAQFDVPRITMDHNLKIEIVSKGVIKFPTSMAFLGPNDILVLEKNEGTVKRILNGTVLSEPLLRVNVANQNESGMLGIAVTTKHFLNQNKKEDIKQEYRPDTVFVFLYYTETKGKDGNYVIGSKEPTSNRLYRYEFVDNKLVNPKLLLELPTTPAAFHNGGKITIGPDNNIYLTVGDLGIFNASQLPTLVQNLKDGQESDGSGGILRITQNGQIVGKGILGKEHSLSLYFAYGIRNSFGIDFDPVTGNLWDTENGLQVGDEINQVKPGFNSGWVKVQGVWELRNQTIIGIFNNTKQLVNFKGTGKYSSPEFVWKQIVGPTDIKFLNSIKLGKDYENDIFVGDFHNGYLYHFDLNNDRTQLSLQKPLIDKMADNKDELEKVTFAKGFGGITDLEVGPDGYLYVLGPYFGGSNCGSIIHPNEHCVPYNSANIGSIFRIVPVK